ncbi:hypothetical protein L9F63_011837, partial [Diploptera punctata]
KHKTCISKHVYRKTELKHVYQNMNHAVSYYRKHVYRKTELKHVYQNIKHVYQNMYIKTCIST